MNKRFFCRNSKNMVFVGLMLLAGGGWGNQIVGQGLSIQQTDDACNAALELVYKQGDSTHCFEKISMLEKKISPQSIQEAIVNLTKARVYIRYIKIDKTFMYLQKAVSVFEEKKQFCYLSFSYNLYASAFQTQADGETVQKYLDLAAKNLNQCEQESYWIPYYTNTANLRAGLRDSSQARKMYFKALLLCEKHKKWKDYAGNMYNIGYSYMNYNQINEALFWFNKATESNKKHGYSYIMPLDQTIKILIDYKKEFTKAAILIPELIKIQERGGDGERLVGSGYLRLGEVYLGQKKYAEAKVAFDKCLKISELSGLDNAKHQAREGIANYHATVGDFKNAYLQLEQAYYLADKVRNGLMSEKAQQKQALYDLKGKSTAIEQLEKDKRIQQIMLLLGILAGLGGIGVFVLILRNRKIEKQAMQTRLELQERELLSNTIYMEQRNEVLENIKQQIVEGQESKKYWVR